MQSFAYYDDKGNNNVYTMSPRHKDKVMVIYYIFCYLGSHKMKGASLTLFTVATRTRPVFHNAPDVL